MLRRLNRWLEANRWVGDAVIATALLVASLVGYVSSGQRSEFAVSAVLLLPLFARRTLPRTVTVVVALLCLWQLTVLSRPVLGDVAAVLVVHSATAYVRARWWGIATWAAAVCGAGVAAVLWFGLGEPTAAIVGFTAGFGAVSAAYLLGARHRDQREHVQEQLAALRERNRLLAVERDQRAEMAAARERTTIARELHDIVAHSLTVIVVQADGAAAAVRAAPDRADIAPMVLDTIAEISREALAEMRQLVGVLRSGSAGSGSGETSGQSFPSTPAPSSGDGKPGGRGLAAGSPPMATGSRPFAGAGTPAASLAPSPGLGDLTALVEQVATTGLHVTLARSGPERELSPALGLTVYRVVQESLTNVLRHGGPAASATIELAFTAEHLRLTVVDSGRGAAAAPAVPDNHPRDNDPGDNGSGHGLLGMRERVRVHGGTLRTGPRQGGGFEVCAELPLPPRRTGGSLALPAAAPPAAAAAIDVAR